MAPRETNSHSVPPRRLPIDTPRLRLRARGEDIVDGVWWARTQDLAAELPGLFTALRPCLGPVRRVVYDPTGWFPSARHLQLGSHRIRLDPYRFELFNTMYVCGVHGIVVVLQVIPSITGASVANATLAAASGAREAGRS